MSQRWADRLINCALWTVFLSLFLAIATVARAHDIYEKLTRSPTDSRICCGGDPVTGDCEPLLPDQIRESGGSFIIESRRYGASVLLPTGGIAFLPVPGEAPGTAGHWCGKPRAKMDPRGNFEVVADDQPDPVFWTFCAYLNPGGS